MGRPSKFPNHPLVRLRRQLSYLRKDLAQQSGIPEPSLRSIEAGHYKMSPKVIAKISLLTGVSPESFRVGEEPLLDISGRPLTKNSANLLLEIKPLKTLQKQAKQKLSAALQIAEDKNCIGQFTFLFNEWLEQQDILK